MAWTLSELTLGVFADDPYAALDVHLELSEHPHPRARIRDWVVKRLRAAALEPDRISVSRAAPVMLIGVPSVLVYLLREAPAENFTEAPLVYARPLELALHVVIAEKASLPVGASLDDIIDGFCEVFESLMLCDVDDHGLYFGRQAVSCDLGETVIEPENDGERIFMHVRTTFAIGYQREVGRPASTPLRLIHGDWDLAAPIDGRIDAVDVVYLPVASALAGIVHVRGDFAGTVGP